MLLFSKSATSININLRKGQGKAFAFKTKFLSVSLSDIDCPQHVFRQQKLVREAFGLSPKERLLLDERLYAKRWKSSKEKMKEEGLEREEGEEEEEEEVTAIELARLVEESKLMGRDLRSLVRAEEELDQCKNFQRLLPKPEGLRFLRYLGRWWGLQNCYHVHIDSFNILCTT